MKLTKQIKVNKYRVLADYKVEVKNSPFMAILQLALEQGGKISSEILYNELLRPLSYKACKNLLDRLSEMGYFSGDYSLTNLGYKSINTKIFYDQRNGLLEIWIAEDNEFSSKIIKLKELPYDNDKETETKEKVNELKALENTQLTFTLNNGSFTIDNIKEQIKYIKREDEQLTITINNNYCEIKLVDFSGKKNSKRQNIINEIMKNQFNEMYNIKDEILLVDFNSKQLQLNRNTTIIQPQYKNTVFNKIEIQNTKVSPKSFKEAQEWHLALLKQQINKYYLSDKEFDNYENNIASKFELFNDDLKNTVSRQDLILEFTQEKDFYKKSKIETIDYLTY